MPRKAATTSPYTLMTLACDALQVDAGIQPRLVLNHSVVEEYATLYQEAEDGHDPLPPSTCFRWKAPRMSPMAFTGWRPPAGRPCAARCIPAHAATPWCTPRLPT